MKLLPRTRYVSKQAPFSRVFFFRAGPSRHLRSGNGIAKKKKKKFWISWSLDSKHSSLSTTHVSGPGCNLDIEYTACSSVWIMGVHLLHNHRWLLQDHIDVLYRQYNTVLLHLYHSSPAVCEWHVCCVSVMCKHIVHTVHRSVCSTWWLLRPWILLPVLQDVGKTDGDVDGRERGQITTLRKNKRKTKEEKMSCCVFDMFSVAALSCLSLLIKPFKLKKQDFFLLHNNFDTPILKWAETEYWSVTNALKNIHSVIFSSCVIWCVCCGCA